MTPRPRVQPATSAFGPQIGSYDCGRHIVVWAEGEIDGASAPKLRDELVAAIDRRSARLVIDLTGATFASAPCLDVLMGALRAAEIIGGDVRLVGAGRRLRELLAQAGLQPVFVDGSVNDAVAQSGLGVDGAPQVDGAATER